MSIFFDKITEIAQRVGASPSNIVHNAFKRRSCLFNLLFGKTTQSLFIMRRVRDKNIPNILSTFYENCATRLSSISVQCSPLLENFGHP